jgi:very-short-patch-repair endonuclease
MKHCGRPPALGNLRFEPRAAPLAYARRLRAEQTDAERCLWRRLRRGVLGARFRRQHPLAGYIVDFCCLRHNLIVELDGSQHAEREAARRDACRDAALARLGLRVVRFSNHQALMETDAVIETIARLLAPSPCPLPPGEGSRIVTSGDLPRER